MTRLGLMLAACAGSVVFGPMAWCQAPAKPGPEHELLKKFKGTWDMTARAGGAESKGTSTCKMELGGLWVTSEIKAEFPKGSLLCQKYEQKGMATYDATKKKYVFVWADSVSTTLYLVEGTYDETAKKLTTTGAFPGSDGKTVNFKVVAEFKDDDNFVQTISVVGRDGKEQEIVTIWFTRK